MHRIVAKIDFSRWEVARKNFLKEKWRKNKYPKNYNSKFKIGFFFQAPLLQALEFFVFFIKCESKISQLSYTLSKC